MFSLFLQRAFTFLLCAGWLLACAYALAGPAVQSPAQIEATLAKIRQLEPTGDEYFPDNPKYSRQRRLIRRLPPEAVPVLIHAAQAATKPEDEAFAEYLLRQKINHYGVPVSENLRQTGIDFLLSRCAQTSNAKLRAHLLAQLRSIDDPKVEAFAGQLAASANPAERAAAEKFLQERPAVLAGLRRKLVPQTREQLVATIDGAMHPERRGPADGTGGMAPESAPLLVSILSQRLRESQDEQERRHYMQFLRGDLEEYEDILPAAAYQEAIDAMIHECERMNEAGERGQLTFAQGTDLQRRMMMLENFEDLKIDRFFERMATSQNVDARTMADLFKKSKEAR